MLCDRNSFIEYDQLMEHDCVDFGMEKKKVTNNVFLNNKSAEKIKI